MSRRHRAWREGITPAGLIVTSTLAVVALALALGLVYRFVVDGAMDQAGGTYLLSVLAALTASQSRLRPDPAATVEQPATITAQSEPPAS